MKNSKKYLTQEKSLKVGDNPKILTEYSPLLHSEKTEHELTSAIINDVKYMI